jgi:hypothetical protein
MLRHQGADGRGNHGVWTGACATPGTRLMTGKTPPRWHRVADAECWCHRGLGVRVACRCDVRMALGRARGQALDRARGQALEKARGQALEKARGQALEKARGQALETARGRALDRTRGQALGRARGQAVVSPPGLTVRLSRAVVSALEGDRDCGGWERPPTPLHSGTLSGRGTGACAWGDGPS